MKEGRHIACFGIHQYCHPADILRYFAQFGNVVDMLWLEKTSGHFYVTFASQNDTKRLIYRSNMSALYLNNRIFTVTPSIHPQKSTNRRSLRIKTLDRSPSLTIPQIYRHFIQFGEIEYISFTLTDTEDPDELRYRLERGERVIMQYCKYPDTWKDPVFNNGTTLRAPNLLWMPRNNDDVIFFPACRSVMVVMDDGEDADVVMNYHHNIHGAEAMLIACDLSENHDGPSPSAMGGMQPIQSSNGTFMTTPFDSDDSSPTLDDTSSLATFSSLRRPIERIRSQDSIYDTRRNTTLHSIGDSVCEVLSVNNSATRPDMSMNIKIDRTKREDNKRQRAMNVEKYLSSTHVSMNRWIDYCRALHPVVMQPPDNSGFHSTSPTSVTAVTVANTVSASTATHQQQEAFELHGHGHRGMIPQQQPLQHGAVHQHQAQHHHHHTQPSFSADKTVSGDVGRNGSLNLVDMAHSSHVMAPEDPLTGLPYHTGNRPLGSLGQTPMGYASDVGMAAAGNSFSSQLLISALLQPPVIAPCIDHTMAQQNPLHQTGAVPVHVPQQTHQDHPLGNLTTVPIPKQSLAMSELFDLGVSPPFPMGSGIVQATLPLSSVVSTTAGTMPSDGTGIIQTHSGSDTGVLTHPQSTPSTTSPPLSSVSSTSPNPGGSTISPHQQARDLSLSMHTPAGLHHHRSVPVHGIAGAAPTGLDDMHGNAGRPHTHHHIHPQYTQRVSPSQPQQQPPQPGSQQYLEDYIDTIINHVLSVSSAPPCSPLDTLSLVNLFRERLFRVERSSIIQLYQQQQQLIELTATQQQQTQVQQMPPQYHPHPHSHPQQLGGGFNTLHGHPIP